MDQDVQQMPADLDKLQSQLGELLSPNGNEQRQIAEDCNQETKSLARTGEDLRGGAKPKVD
jgi:hypothetical protein